MAKLLRTLCGRFSTWQKFGGERAGAGRPRRKVAVQGGTPHPSRRLEPSGTPDGHRQVGRADLVALTVSGGVNDGLDHTLRVEAWWRLARREVLEGGDVLLNDRRRRHHGPQLLTGIHRVRRSVHVLLEGIDAQVHRPGHGRLNQRTSKPSSLVWKCTFQFCSGSHTGRARRNRRTHGGVTRRPHQ